VTASAFERPTGREPAFEDALRFVQSGAGIRDAQAEPTFPEGAFAQLEGAGLTSWNAVAGAERPGAGAELELVRRVARADGSVGRIFDGHLNAVERIAVQASPELRDRELNAVLAGRLRAGVWGGDPRCCAASRPSAPAREGFIERSSSAEPRAAGRPSPRG